MSRLSAGYRSFESHCVWTVWHEMCCTLTDCSECCFRNVYIETLVKTHALPHLWQSRFPNGFWELVPVVRHYIANSFDLHRPMGLHSTTDREISRFWTEKEGFAMLPSGYRCDIDCGLGNWRASDKITCVDFHAFSKAAVLLDVGNHMTERCSEVMLGHRRYTLSESRRWKILRLPSSMYM